IILVRTGRQKGKAIGIVLKNDYAESGLNENSRIHVLWINKSEEQLSGLTDMHGFNKAGPGTRSAFATKESYKPSFDLINSLTGNFSENDDDSQQEADTMQYPLNQILYGPPGTGKTWNTVNHAVAIIEDKSLDELEEEDREEIKWRFDELKKNGQIEMVTFHQNFTYEDFIEGIRPVLDEENEKIEYELSEGVFKKIADRANKNRTQSEQTGEESWDTDELLQAFAESIENRLESGEEINLFPPDHRSGATIGEINWSRDGKFQSFKLGGTIKYQRLTKNVIKRDYEAFYKGEIKSLKDIKPTYKSKRTQHGNAMYYFALYGKIKQFHDEEWQSEESGPIKKQNYVLIIDEINRGNIARIFGELITLIEPSKRIGGDDAATFILPYSKEKFGVPDNLYIIGTMNTADRSIALLDTALRRRFDFIEMMPDAKHHRISTDIEGVNCQELLAAMNDRIRFLLDREHQIGHTYFMGIKRIKGKDSLEATFKNKIIPLLQEYFYDNWEKIDLVLNCNGFVHEIPFESDLFKNSDLIDEERKIYELSDEDGKWEDPESYQAIYAQGQSETGESG
ncbi:MAG: AAA domain-containing protein, partial [Gemmatimonadetes bacterium]|nr:AAA domain-containing protein [Gemmatimonadota bacterium]